MIELINKGKVVTIEYDEEQACSVLKLAKKVTVKPHETFKLDTKIEVKCSEFLDECVISELVEDDTPLFIMSDKYSMSNPETIIELVCHYAGEEEKVLPKGTTIACVGTYTRQDKDNKDFVTFEENEKFPVLFNDGKLRIQQRVEGDVEYTLEQILEPNGESYIKLKKKDNE